MTRERVLLIVLMIATAVAFYLCYRMLVPFLPAIAWGLALAVVAWPIHRWISRRVSSPNLAAGLSVAVVTLMLVIPGLFVLNQLSREAIASAERIRTLSQEGHWREAIEQNPRLAPALHWVEANLDIEQELGQFVQNSLGNLATLVPGTIWMVIQMLLTLYLLFYFFRDRHFLMEGLRSLEPLSRAESDEVAQRIRDTIHGTINGTLFVAAIQGTLAGLMFWFLGLPAPLLWGVVMALLSVVPYLGSALIWTPTAIYLALEGDWYRASLLGGWGLLVVGTIDNLLYPLVVGKQLRVHPLIAFLGILGGISAFGGSGLILGPVIVAITWALVDIWRLRTAGNRPAEKKIESPRVVQEGTSNERPTDGREVPQGAPNSTL